MKSKNIAIMIMGLLFASGIASAIANVGTDQFTGACKSCSFDENGKMDKECWKSYEDSGKTSLAAAYPIMSGKYMFGDCPQVDVCVSRLQACKASFSTGSDTGDCNSAGVLGCFMMGDTCMYAANQVCAEGKSEDEAGFNNKSAGGTKEDDIIEVDKGETDLLRMFGCFEPMFIVLFVTGGAFYFRKS
jgi:hypothetical protein